MKALLFALRLGMARPAMQHAHAKPHQPDAEGGQRIAAGIAPRPTVVHQHGERQAVAAKGVLERPAHRLALLVAAGGENDIVTRAIVERGQRMAAPAVNGEAPLEVHLPKLVRARPLEAPPWSRMLACVGFPQAVVPAQDLSDRARRRDLRLIALLKRPPDLPPAPHVVAAVAHLKHLGLDRRRGSARTGLGPPRLLDQSGQTLVPMAGKPLVSGRRTDPETPAKLANVHPLAHRKLNELPLLIHRRHPSKRHPVHSRFADRETVHDVSERLSTMSPVYTGPARGKGRQRRQSSPFTANGCGNLVAS